MRLDSVRILDLSRLLPGPYATQLLADAGADVVKVEDTDAGDYARHTPPTTDRGVGALFDSVNRGKRSVALDLKSGAGREAFYDLVEEADVVFEQFRPGVADRLEIGYETLVEYNEDLVYCSLSGFGQSGPYAERAGHDLNYVGIAGLLDMTREDEAMAPQIPGYQVGDLGGGLFAAFSIVGGLLSRELGNGGEYIDVAMTDVVASFSQAVSHEALTGGDPRPGETALTGRYPWYDVYETADGRYVTLAALEPKFWEAFCEDAGCEDLVDYHGSEDPAELEAVREELTALFAARTRDAWLDELSDEAMVGPVCTPAEALEHPQLEARGLIERPDDAPPRVGFPAVGSNVPERRDESVPGHGEHTDELLASVGYDEGKRAALRETGAIR
ncbi:CaiB/BaiF CoA transferase family protein [Natrinema versiforme]|uniref:L-carnitine dehydratase/bile acid-inducible protein F n=1 Tax=Natrinema versiforme JCM 10478 TaxID=1227496 RepID=L9XTW4_9EURY|nr:CaiB/BaiF CoA-transferase family protein [Natrinema versiforme]ELY64982.1 L-carnitine dehydratase/bile acid-inducible protein F [Natrinema versiforme JCM 10478]